MLKKKLKNNLTLGNKKKLASRRPVDEEDDEDEDTEATASSEDEEDDEEDDEDETPKAKKGRVLGATKKKKPDPDDEDEDEDDDDDDDSEDDDDGEDEEDEEEAPKKNKKGSVGTTVRTKDKVLGKTPTKKKSSSASPLSSAWNSVPLTNSADDIPTGKYEAVIKSFVLQEPDSKGQSARVNYELCSPDFAENNQIPQWFKLVDKDGEKVEGGIRALKSALAKLGYEPDADELEECFEQITDEHPGVLLKVSYSKDGDGNTWQRANIQGTCDNDVVQEYKDNVQY